MTLNVIKSLSGVDLGFSQGGSLVSRKGFTAGKQGSHFALAHPDRVVYFEDFLGNSRVLSTTVGADGLRSRKGSDGACVDWTVTPDSNGKVVGTIGQTTATMAVSGVQLDQGLSYKAAQGLSFETRLKMSSIANMVVYVGFTDQTAALELPIHSAGGLHTVTTNASDAVGIMYDTTDSGTDQWLAVGVANDVDAIVQANLSPANAAIVPVADTYEVFRIDVSTLGVATFYRNGQQIGTLAGMQLAVTPTVFLTPVVAAFNRATGVSPTIALDYWHVATSRV